MSISFIYFNDLKDLFTNIALTWLLEKYSSLSGMTLKMSLLRSRLSKSSFYFATS